MNVAIIDYGAGNTRSLQFALERIGVSSVLTADSDVIQHADKVIFPGQGAAQSAMEKLKQKKLDLLLHECTKPVLGFCLVMKVICQQT
jgi:glutamine amidotransferase